MFVAGGDEAASAAALREEGHQLGRRLRGVGARRARAALVELPRGQQVVAIRDLDARTTGS